MKGLGLSSSSGPVCSIKFRIDFRMPFFRIFLNFGTFWLPFWLHFCVIFDHFCITCSKLVFAQFLYRFFFIFAPLEPPKPCFYCSKSIVFAKSPFRHTIHFGVHFWCLLASLLGHFIIIFRYFFGIDFSIDFGRPFFRTFCSIWAPLGLHFANKHLK